MKWSSIAVIVAKFLNVQVIYERNDSIRWALRRFLYSTKFSSLFIYSRKKLLTWTLLRRKRLKISYRSCISLFLNLSLSSFLSLTLSLLPPSFLLSSPLPPPFLCRSFFSLSLSPPFAMINVTGGVKWQ